MFNKRPNLLKVFITLFSFFILFSIQVMAQLPGGNLANFKVENLSGAQWQSVVNDFRSSGLSESQYAGRFSARGLSEGEISKLIARLRQSASTGSQRSINDLREEVSMGTDKGLDNNLQAQDKNTELERKIFGFQLFKNSETNFTPNLNMATPKGYVIGPGDDLQLQVYGVAQSTYALKVSNEGQVSIQNIGVANIGGLTIEAATALLKEKLSIRYAGMRGPQPNTFTQLTLTNIRSIKVNMVGEVTRPGTYTLPSYVNVFNALFAAGGPTIKGSFRSVQVIRNGRVAGDIDIYDYISTGKLSQNIRLEDNDVVLIKPAQIKVEVLGPMRIEGIFEMKSQESFNDLLRFTGGFSDDAYKGMVTVTRRGLTENQVLDLSESMYASAKMQDGDLIEVRQLLDRFTNRVQISGSVNRPGPYALIPGMKLFDLIQKAGGLKGDAFLKRAILYRTKSDFTQEAIPIDLSSLENSSSTNNIPLKREDVLSISSIYDLREEYYVQVSGEVNNTGLFPYSDSMTVADVLLRAGGLRYSASGSFIEIARRQGNEQGKIAEVFSITVNKDLSLDPAGQKFVVKPFDHVFVRALPGIQEPKKVTIKGEVKYPGDYVIDKKEMRISDLLSRSGGLSPFAYTKGATLIRQLKKKEEKTTLELELERLEQIKLSLDKDAVLSTSETNTEVYRRISQRIEIVKEAIEKEKKEQEEKKKAEADKQQLIRETSALTAGNNVAQIEEKSQDLVAVDFDKIVATPGSDADLILKDGDIIEIPEKLETVSVKGGVLYPVSVRYEEGISFREYIDRAGGFSPQAIRKRSYVIQANGKVERVRSFLLFRSYPTVEPGAEVVVPISTATKAPFSYERILGTVTSTLTLVFLLRTL